MNQEQKKKSDRNWYFPPLGQRIVKTTVAVVICLAVYALRGYRGINMPTEAAITAIICLQPYASDTAVFAMDRFMGTLIGAFWGLLFLLVMLIFPILGTYPILLYGLMGLGTLVSLYTAVVLRRPDTSSLAAIVFICVVIAYPDIEAPLQQAFHRIIDVLVGTTTAIVVNIARLPREKRRDRVFFVRTKDLVSDQLAQVSSTVLFRLNYLYNDGAKICLISEHAPAFFMSQMSAVRMNVPLIVMDGAAIYDARENVYLSIENVPAAGSSWLTERLNGLHPHYFIYTVHNHRTCVFHHGEITKSENIVYQHMKRSPYRHYLDDDSYVLEEIVYIKAIVNHAEVTPLLNALGEELASHGMRAAVRPQAGLPGSSSLYFYSLEADVAHAEEKLMDMLREKEPELHPVEVFSATEYQTEHDAVHILHSLGKKYEPLWIAARMERKRE